MRVTLLTLIVGCLLTAPFGAGCREGGDGDGDSDGDSDGDGDGDGDSDGDGDGDSDGDGDGDGDSDAVCGNGVVEGDEECDDGNIINDDDCVLYEGACTEAFCGDGYVRTDPENPADAEECEPGSTRVCPGGRQSCNDNCTWGECVICDDVDSPCDVSGMQRCSADGAEVEQCQEDADGCLVWYEVESCGSHKVCSGEECLCDDECAEVGASFCEGNVVVECSRDADGCLFEEGQQNCESTDQECDDSSGTAECVG